MGTGDDPLRIGGGKVPAEPQNARAEMCGGVDLVGRVFRTEFDGMRAFTEFRGPVAVAHQQAPVVGRADRVEQIEVRAGIGVEVDVTAAVVAAGNDGGDAHVEIGVGLPLAVHAGKAVDQAGDEKLARAVDDLRALGHWNDEARADIGDAAILNNDDGVLQIDCRAAPVGDIDDGAADQNQWRGAGFGATWPGGCDDAGMPPTAPGASMPARYEKVAYEKLYLLDCRTRPCPTLDDSSDPMRDTDC